MITEGNILVFTQWSYKDALVQTYTIPYVDIVRKLVPAVRKIIVLTAEQPHLALSDEEVTRINKEWSERNMQLLPLPYNRFGIKKIFQVTGQLFRLHRLIHKEKIRIIHAFCTPAGSMAYLLSVWTGARLIVDSYEPHAEAMVENGTWKKGGTAFRILFSLERKLTKRASALIATTAGMRDYALDKFGVTVKNFFVKPACVDLEKFSNIKPDLNLVNELGLDQKIVCVYAGKLGGIYLKEEVFDFIGACYRHWKDDFRFLTLTNASGKEIKEQLDRVKIPHETVITRFVSHDQVAQYMSVAHFALNPVKPVPTKKYCTSIKDGEYWAMGLPVVISPRISDDSAIIEKEEAGVVLDYTDSAAFPGAIKKIENLVNEVHTKDKIRSLAVRYRSFSIAEHIYKEIYC